MKLIINSSILDTKPTGIGIYTLNLLKKFEKYDLDCIVFTSLNTITSKKIIYISKYVRPYPYKKLGGILRFLMNQIYFTYVGKKYDIAYLPTPHGSIFLKNQIVTVHDLLALHYPAQHKLQYYYYKYFMPIILKNAKKVIAISESTKKDLINFYNLDEKKIKVIYNGFDKNHFSYKSDAKEYIYNKYNIQKYIFTVGSSYPHKNIDKLIEAFIQMNNKDLVLVITGEIGEYQKKMIEKYNVQNIFFIGFIDFKDLPYFYSAAEIMIYPSLYEGFGFPPLEAMSCNCPVIASNTSSIPEVCGNAVEYINPHELDSIIKSINKVKDNKQYRDSLIAKGLLQVEKFTWEKASKEIITLFEEVSS